MAFATEWLEKRAVFPQLFSEPPDKQTGIIVVIPAYDEPGIGILLNSLASCDEPDCTVEVIIIINAPSVADAGSLRNNIICIDNIEKWKRDNRRCFFRLHYFNAGQPEIKGWGVGLARKTGMDEALRRFDAIGRPEGVIVSLDADCTVDQNYFVVLFSELYRKKERKACSIQFEHFLSGDEFPDDVYWYVTMYELHMWYFYLAVRYSGYPYAFHTIGSAIAFRASAYLKAGGMNRRQAGEDFYFIQKLVLQEGYFSLCSTTVHPSPRTSVRVPFGTGAVISKLLDAKTGQFMTYNPDAFVELRILFTGVGELFGSKKNEPMVFYSSLPPGIRSFIDPGAWLEKITEIKNNVSSRDSFLKRFFGWFNMFRIVKYLNHVHSGMFEKLPVTGAAYKLSSLMGRQLKSRDPYDLLISYRLLEKGN